MSYSKGLSATQIFVKNVGITERMYNIGNVDFL